MRQLSRKAAVSAAAATMVLATASTGLAAGTGILDPSPTTKAQSAKGTFVGAGSFFITIDAKRAKGAPETKATGTFTGQAMFGGTRLLKFAGPITCLYVKGSTVGLFYPVTSSDPAVVAMLGAGVFIYAQTDGHGHATSMNFLPAPSTRTDGCAPLPTFIPATGSLALSGG